MNRFRNYAWMAAGFAMLSVVAGIFSAGPAIAQAVRAALVSNVDDPGRIPYEYMGHCSFDGSFCGFSFPAVPSGKRLVITHVSGRIVEDLPGGTLIDAELVAHNLAISMPVTYTGNSLGFNSFVFDQSSLVSYDTGQVPRSFVVLGASPRVGSFVDVVLMGYMLDCNTGPCAAIAP